jgi:hypothetical protein
VVDQIVSVLAYLGIGLLVLFAIDYKTGELENWSLYAPNWLVFIVLIFWPIIAFLYLSRKKHP